MRKERLTHFRKKLEEKYQQLVDEVGKNVLYGKGPEDDSIKDLGDQATSAYNREFLFELGNGDRRSRRSTREDSAIASAAVRPSPRSDWKPFRSRDIASSASARWRKRSAPPHTDPRGIEAALRAASPGFISALRSPHPGGHRAVSRRDRCTHS